jgi:hypothetical protein
VTGLESHKHFLKAIANRRVGKSYELLSRALKIKDRTDLKGVPPNRLLLTSAGCAD